GRGRGARGREEGRRPGRRAPGRDHRGRPPPPRDRGARRGRGRRRGARRGDGAGPRVSVPPPHRQGPEGLMRATLVVAAKDLRQRLRDRSLFIFGALVPFALTFIFDLLLGPLGGDAPFNARLAL